eukprot:gnl/Ergobibamus_cyprinoides/345.p1 GENE.gnl/Ergobibamus_cyprinoides/345~~gnl/Ergobibamus_cyprinoides/345.p1  ORF type:complete len:375 (+),score=127.68 gnl/Ergobibamus_cyprinoides/345:55-1125(+)
MFYSGYSSKQRAYFQKGQNTKYLDAVIFRKTRKSLGGRVSQFFSGSAPLAKRVAEFLAIAFCASVTEGYGATETCSGVCATRVGDRTLGHVGHCDPGVQMKLRSVPELAYTVLDKPYPRGELLVRAVSVFKGYYKDEERTAEVLDSDGWYHTGDVAQFLPGGAIQIIDRIKSVFKTSQGEFIITEQVERAMMSSPLLDCCYLYANRFASYVLAAANVSGPALRRALADSGSDTYGDIDRPLSELCTHPAVVAFVTAEVTKSCRVAGLRGFEIPRAILLDAEPWGIDNGLLTPSMKVKRPALRIRFEPQMTAIYDTLNAAMGRGEKVTPDLAAQAVVDATNITVNPSDATSCGQGDL